MTNVPYVLISPEVCEGEIIHSAADVNTAYARAFAVSDLSAIYECRLVNVGVEMIQLFNLKNAEIQLTLPHDATFRELGHFAHLLDTLDDNEERPAEFMADMRMRAIRLVERIFMDLPEFYNHTMRFREASKRLYTILYGRWSFTDWMTLLYHQLFGFSYILAADDRYLVMTYANLNVHLAEPEALLEFEAQRDMNKDLAHERVRRRLSGRGYGSGRAKMRRRPEIPFARE